MDLPYRFIAKSLSEGAVVPFLGAGASLAGASNDARRLPDGHRLAQDLIEHFGDYPDDDRSLTKIAQFCQECVAGRTPLYRRLRKTFYADRSEDDPGPVAEMLAQVRTPLNIVTTNYDSNVETAFQRADRPYSVVTHITNREHSKWGFLLVQRSEEPQEVSIIKPSDFRFADHLNRTIIYKIHGSFGDEESFNPKVDTIVITEDDYVDFMLMMQFGKFPPAFARDFQQKHFLFLGYSLEDWNFRVILRKIQLTADLGQDFQSWAIQRNPSETERRFWSKRAVDLYQADLIEFSARVRELFGAEP